MPEYRAPGVYVEEVDRGPKAIEGVSTSTAAFLGQTERGPTDPEFVTNVADFERKYGGFTLYTEQERLAGTYLAYAVDGFFRNGGTRAYVGRIVPEGMPTAHADLRANEPGSVTPRIDFGTVRTNTSSTKAVTLTNVADSDVSIDTANTGVSTGGQFAAGPPTATRLAAGDSTTIEVTYAPDDANQHEGELDVQYLDSETPANTNVLTVALVGEGGDALATDAKHVEFPGSAFAEPDVRRVTLSNLGNEPVAIDADGIEVTDGTDPVDEFEAEVTAADVGPEGATTLVVRFRPSAPTDYQATVTVPYTVDTTQASLEIDVSGAGLPALVPDLSVVEFARVDNTGTTTAPVTVTLTNESSADVTIDAAGVTLQHEDGSDATEFDASDPDPTTLGPGERAEVEVTFTAPDDARHAATLTVPYTADGAGPFEATVELLGQGPTDLAADRLRVDFGAVAFPGRSDVETVRLTNTAGAELVIDSLVAEDDSGTPVEAFEVAGPAQNTLAPDAQATVEVTFAPSEASETGARLRVSYTVGSDSGTFDVELVAEAAPPFDVSTSVTFGTITAVGPGVWGRHVAAYVDAGSLHKPDNPLFKLTLRYWSHEDEVGFVSDNGVNHPDAPAPTVEEVYDNLTLNEASSDYFVKRVNDASNLVEVAREGSVTPSRWDVEPVWLTERFPTPAPAVTVDDYRGESTPGARTGFAALEEIDDISIVCVPDEASGAAELQGLTDETVTHCATLKDRFAVLQAPERAGDLENLEPRVGAARLDSTYAAFYYPWLTVRNPETNMETLVPPAGHVAGIYARSDTERGVHKAPANEAIRGIHDLQLSVTKAEQEILNPKGVNCIRNFPGRGIRVWGARTTSTDPSWKYVNVRRLFLYLEESIDEGTQWVVFEPNDENLWARVRQTVGNFLTTVWRNGALMGTTAEEAFYVKCDRSTMTQDDIDNGRLIVEIGVAPVKPAEFVIFRISQWTGGAEGA